LTTGARLKVRLTPRSSKDRLTGWDGEVLKVNLTAPPIDGQANRSLLKFLAKILNLRFSDLSLDQGAASRQKTIVIESLSEPELKDKLELLTQGLPKPLLLDVQDNQPPKNGRS
jgi:uncharacterized protein (TIGR00251 family)